MMKVVEFLGVLVVTITIVGTLHAFDQQPPSAYEEARLQVIALRQELMVAQGRLALAEKAVAECAAERGTLQLTINQAVLDGLMAEFRRQYEAAHPGFTWNFETKGPEQKRD